MLNLGPRLLRAGVLLRRPASCSTAWPRRPRPPCGSASSSASSRLEAAHAGALRAGARGRPADPAELPARASSPTCRAGRSRPTTGPAREVGGDFYDVIPLPDGQVGFVVGDVTDKGVPAALVMAATRSVLRASAQRLVEPGVVLERVNEHLCPDMPAKMFVTCLYGVLEPASGPPPLRQRRPRPALRQDRGRRRSSCARAACRSGSCRAWPTRRRRPCWRRATRCSCTPTASSRRTRPTATCSASRG